MSEFFSNNTGSLVVACNAAVPGMELMSKASKDSDFEVASLTCEIGHESSTVVSCSPEVARQCVVVKGMGRS
jgi:hypothetical protein